MVYPVEWLDATFSSRPQTVALLRPELESGTIRPHDFDLATQFLPGFSRYLPYTYGFAAGALAGALGVSRRPPWKAPRTLLASSLAGALGGLYGQIRRVRAHLTFADALDDPAGFARALESVHLRTGGTRPLGLSFVSKKRAASDPEADADGHAAGADSPADGWGDVAAASAGPPASANTGTRSGPGADPAPPPAAQKRPPSRWDDIRNVHNKSAQPSTWDAIRQSKERARLPGAVRRDAGADAGAGDDAPLDDRALEQARFDAMLEAERRLGVDGDRRGT